MHPKKKTKRSIKPPNNSFLPGDSKNIRRQNNMLLRLRKSLRYRLRLRLKMTKAQFLKAMPNTTTSWMTQMIVMKSLKSDQDELILNRDGFIP